MAIITPSLLSALFTGFNNTFQKVFNETPTDYDKIATTILSSSASNTYGWLGQFPQFREWIGDRVIKDMAAKGYHIINKSFESTVGVKATDIEDDNIGIYSPLVSEMGRAARVHPDELVFPLLKAGQATACYDGQNFFDAEHPVYANVDGTGTPSLVSNLFAPTSNPGAPWFLMDTSRALKPIIYQLRKKPRFTSMTKDEDEAVFMRNEYRYGVDDRCNVGYGFWQLACCSTLPLNQENFNTVFDAMCAFVADGNRPLGIKPNLLVVPTTLRTAADEVVVVERLSSGASNPNKDKVKVLVTPWLN